MKNLREIVRIITQKQLKKITIYDPSKMRRTDKYARFYKGILSGRYQTDKDAASELYGVGPNDKKYQMLKSRVKKRLLDTLFFIEVGEPSDSAHNSARFHCQKNLTHIHLMLANGARGAAIELTHKTLTKASEFRLVNVELECLRILREHSGLKGEAKDFERFAIRISSLRKVIDALDESKELVERIQLQFAKTGAKMPHIDKMLARFCARVDQLRATYDHPGLHLDYFYLSAIACQIDGRFANAITECTRAEEYLRKHPKSFRHGVQGRFTMKKLVCALHLRDYESAARFADECDEFFQESANNWFDLQEQKFRLAMQSERFENAAQIYAHTSRSPRFVLLAEQKREKWKICYGYLAYAVHNESRLRPSLIRLASQFDLNALLGNVPIYAKDKRGYNVSIITLQILIFLEFENFDGILSRTDALRRYSSRYLKNDYNFRSNCFIKMLFLLEQHNFDAEQMRRAGKSYLLKLTDVKSDYRRGIERSEIIPYDILWRRILSTLQDLQRRGRILSSY